MNRKRTDVYLERLDRHDPRLVREYEILLPTEFKPSPGTPYVWLIASEVRLALITTNRSRPVWRQLEYQHLNSVRLELRNLVILFNALDIADVTLPIPESEKAEAERAIAFITRRIETRQLGSADETA